MSALATAAERTALPMDDSLSIINPFPKLLEGPGLLHHLISGPRDAVALDYTDVEGNRTYLSYSELHDKAENLASRLLQYRQQRPRPQTDIIPVYISQSPSLYISILAILKSGAAFCPLNLDVPEERLKFILKDTSAQVILTTSQLRSTLPVLEDVVILSVDEEDTHGGSSKSGDFSPDNVSTSGNPLAYIMYTSGSTGLPKAVCLPHKAVTQSLLAHDKHVPTFTRFLQFASPTFDVSVFEIFFPWFRGSTLVCCDRSRLLSDLPGMMTSLEVDAAELTPSVAASLVRKRENVPKLKTLLTIGEMLNVQVIQEFGGSQSQASMLWAMYGPTEAAIHCTLQPGSAADMPSGTIGIPLDTVSCFIVKPAESAERAGDIEILPLGEVGELAVGGHQLAAGYLNREQQTRAAFVTHPEFGNLYRTGDKARLLPDGTLECQGRISSGQVKLRGQRIELGEIEHAASKVSGCHAVVASVITGQLVVFCIVENHTITIDDIKNACRKWLPNYMVPNDVALLDDFPYLPSGKVDRRALESGYVSRLSQATSDNHGVSEDLKSLVRVIQRALNVDVDLSADLGAAGLDSLKAIHVASVLRKEGYPRIGALDLLAARTIQDLEAFVRPKEGSAASDEELATTRQQLLGELKACVLKRLENEQESHDISEVQPCTPLQDAMLLETLRNPQAYCNSFLLSVSQDAGSKQLQDCLRSLSDRHPLLRSGFCVSETSSSAYAQVTWKSLDGSQIAMVDAFNESFSIPDQTMLLRPLQFQCKQSTGRVEILVQIHHALYDQWSIEIFVEDLNTLLSHGDLSERPSFQRVNEFFVELKLSPGSQSESLDFWQEYLSGALPGRLPCLTSKTLPTGTLAVKKHTMDIDMSTIQRIAQKHACSVHVFFQAAYAYLLSAYMGTSDVTFGTVFSGRTLPIADVENIFGPILSTLPTRIDISEARKFSDILRRLQHDNRNVMQYSTVSLADIRKLSSVSPGQALFDSIFVWQETARVPVQDSSLVELLDTSDYLEFNLTLEMEPCKDGVQAKATYQPSIIPAEVAETMLQQLESIIKHVVHGCDSLVDDLSEFLPVSLLSVANPEPQNFVYKRGLGSVVEKHAAESPEKVALCFANNIEEGGSATENLTYRELNARANQMAHFLISIGTIPDDLVCICMDKSVDLYIGILAIVKAGAAYLPLVPETPSARIRQILTDANVKTCLTDDGTSNIINDMGLCRVINARSTDNSDCPQSNPQVDFEPTNLAYAVFTSGTTGKPKGVLVTQENILSNLSVLENIYPYSGDSRLLQACNQAFDVSVFEIFFSWFVGICLCSASKDVLFRDLENAINQLGITHLSLTPTVAALVTPTNVPNVKFLVTAGEAVTNQVHKSWSNKGLHQGYGPSETTNICTVNPAVQANHAINNIGPPFENTSAFVLANSPEFRLLPIGALGELCFGGQQVFRGYQNMKDLTESKIIDHGNYGRIYRSGDLGRMLPNGTILIEGRIDDQKKLRGQRIELGEISSILLQSPTVKDCYVQIMGENKQQERLVAFWVPVSRAADAYSILAMDEGMRGEIGALFGALVDELPVYMIPTVLVPLTAIPRTGQGKIDRRRLIHDVQKLEIEVINGFSQDFDDSSDAEGMSDTERALTAALAKVLQIPDSSISRAASFFAIGLDSVSAIRFSSAIKTSLNIQVDVSTILKRSSVAKLAAALQERLTTSLETPSKDRSSIPTSSLPHTVTSQVAEIFRAHGTTVQSILPCTPLQEAMLSASSDGSASAYYNRTVFKLSGDVTKMRHCWNVMLARHTILRTAFTSTEDANFPYLQVVLENMDLPWHIRKALIDDNDSLLEPETDDEVPPVLGFIPPYKLTVYESERGSCLLLAMHHAMYDGNAMANLLQDVEDVYRGVTLPPAPEFSPFLDYMMSIDTEAADAFFDSHLRAYVPKPFTKPEAGNLHRGFGVAKSQLPVSQSIVHEFLQRHNLSLIGLIQAAWVKVLSISQRQPDVCFGNVVSGRSVPVDGVQSLVAPCFNTLPIRIDTAKCRTNMALAKALQKSNVETLPYQMTSLRRVQARCSIEGARLFDSLVLLQQAPAKLDAKIWHLHGESGEMDFPCIVEVVPTDDVFRLSLHFDRSYFGTDDIPSKLCSAFSAAFVSCVRYPSSEVFDLIDFNEREVAGSLEPSQSFLAKAKRSLLESKDHDEKISAKEQWSSMELDIRRAFSAVSGTPEDHISKNTTIYRIGLDSISAIQVAGRLRKQGIALTAGDVMESPSCSQLASVVQSRTSTPLKQTPAFDFEAFDHRHRASLLLSHRIRDADVAAIRPSTAVQAGMISQYLQSDGEEYLNHTFFDLGMGTHADRFVHAWASVMARHEMLRTGFASTDDGLHPFAMLTYKVVDPECTRLQLQSSETDTTTLAERQQTAADAIQKGIHFPPWRWDVFDKGEKSFLQFSAHHALFDAETLRLIQVDLRQALSTGEVSPRESIDSTLSLIVANSLNGKQSQQAFWAQHLTNLAITRFPVLTPVRAPEQDAIVLSNICKVSRVQLEARCRDIGTSLQAAGQAAWARLLSAYTGEPQVTFGVVFSGRTTSETTSCPFPCITTLPVTANASQTNERLLHDLVAYNAAIQKHQFTPLTDIQRYAGSSNEALFDTLFAYQRPLSDDPAGPTWQVIHEKASVDYPISIEMESVEHNRLGFRLTISPAQIPAAQGSVMLRQLEALLLAILGMPATEEEKDLSIVRAKDPFIPTDIAYLHDFVTSSASSHPDKIALEFISDIEDGMVTSKSWTYQQLCEESNRIAQFLIHSGVKSNSVIAASFDKCAEAHFAFLGILKAGCAFCAIDPTAPTARKTFILEDSNASMLLTNASIVSELRDFSKCKVVDLLGSGDELRAFSGQPVQVTGLSPSSVSYLLYTSGTTGTPKGCEITHDNVVQCMLAFQRLFERRVTEKSRWLQFASYHFDVAVVEQFWTWGVGIRLVCAPRDLILEDLAGTIDTLQITHMALTPSLGRLLDPTLVPSLHQGVFITGGEAVKQDMLDSWGDVGCLFNFYGPTECTIGVTTFPSVPCHGKPSNIGWQFDNVGTYVLAPGTHEPVLRGAIGELCISGRLVGKGYLNRPELTAECFPYLEGFGERVYRTGDLVRLLHDDSIDFLGRKDNQVKLRGQRLEIDEIEAVIRQCPEIYDVVCLVAKHPKQQKDLLVAFIGMSSQRKQGEPRASPAEATHDLIRVARTACEEHLPGYMIPTHFIPIDQIPLSVNNKVEEKQLRNLYSTMPTARIQEYTSQSQDQQPLTDAERCVARALATLLKIDAAGLHGSSNIFALGLSSISAIQFSRKLKSEGFESAQVATVMKNPTISKLSRALSSSLRQESGEVVAARQSMVACRQRHTGLAARILGAHAGDFENVVPCTPLQQGIISRSMNSDSSLYFNSFRYKLKEIDTTTLRKAFQTAVEKAQILRTAFIETDDGYVQAVRKELQLIWLETDVPENDLDETLEKRRSKWRSSNAPHLRTPFEVLVVRTPVETVMEVHIHHAIYDGNAYQLLVENITRLYAGNESDFGKPFTEALPYGPLRNANGAKEFWLEHLAGGDQSLMPALSQKATEDTLYSKTIYQTTSADEARRSLNVTLQAVVQAAWVATLRKYYHGCMGTVVSGRYIDFDGAETVLGPLFNTIPFNPSFTGDESWHTLVQRCHDFNISALPFQHTPIRDIMKWCKVRPSEPLFDTLFVFQNAEPSTLEEQMFVPLEETYFEADYPLSFEVADSTDNGLKVTVAAKSSICSLERAEDLVQEFSHALSVLISAPEAKIGESLSFEFTRTENGIDSRRTVTELNGVHGFTWSPKALVLRTEIASVACVDEDEVDEHISIFELGLDSVDAVKLSSRLKKKGVTVVVSALMRLQTIPRILGSLTTTKAADAVTSTKNTLQEVAARLNTYAGEVLDKSADVEFVLPASPMQEALVYEMMKSSYDAYFNHDVLKVAQGVDTFQLERAWEVVVKSSPILRTGFLEVDSSNLDVTFAQVVKSPSAFHFNTVELPADNFDACLQDIQRSFASGPPSAPHFSLTLATTPSGRYLVLSIAHALYDGYSISLLHQDVHKAFNNGFEPRPFYREVLEHSLYDSDRDAISFWRSLLSGATKTHMPNLSENVSSAAKTYRKEKSSSASSSHVSSFCRKHGVTIQALCQTAWAVTLAYYTQKLDVLYGVVLAGRDSQIAEQVMFPTMNTVVMRSVLHGSRQEMLQYMQGTIADITEHQHFPLRKIQAACQKEVQSLSSDPSGSFFNALFTYQKRPGVVAKPSDILYESVTGASDVDYPVAVEAEIEDDNLIWRTACKSHVLSEDGTQEMLDRLDTVLNEIVSHPGSAMLQFESQGVSVCTLPAFKKHGMDTVTSPDTPKRNQNDDESAEWSLLESKIRSVIAQVTKMSEEEVTKRATIQEFGVDSINAIKISSLLRKNDIKISVSEIIKAGSIANMLAFLDARQTQTGPTHTPTAEIMASFRSQNNLTPERFGFKNEEVVHLLPATAGQIYMLSTWQTTLGQVFFPEFEYIVKAEIDTSTIRAAWSSLLKRHEILRTVFCATDIEETPFVQLVMREVSASFTDLDMDDDKIQAESQQPFARLSAKRIEGGFRLGLKIHHALYDAISLPILIADLEQELKMPTTTTPQQSFSDFLALGINAKGRQEFWSQYMNETKPLQLPASSTLSPGGRVEVFDPSVMPMTSRTETILRKHGLSLQALFFAVYAKAYVGLSDNTGDNQTQDAVIGIYLANRSHLEDLSSLVAPTVNLVPFLVKSPRKNTIISVAKQIQQDLQQISTPENSSVALWEIEKWTGVKVDTFVNFIKLPDQTESDQHQGVVQGQSVVIEEADNGLKTEKRSLVHEAHTAEIKQPKELKKNTVKSSYPRSLDIEATVANGALGIGVFGWEDMIGLDRANKLIEEIGEGLREALSV